MSDTTLAWETTIYQNANEPIVRTVYGKTLLEAVQKRWSTAPYNSKRFFVPGLRDSMPAVTVFSGTGHVELVIADEVNEVRVDDIKPSFVVYTGTI